MNGKVESKRLFIKGCEYFEHRARVFERAGRWVEARSVLERAAAVGGRSIELRHQIARAILKEALSST